MEQPIDIDALQHLVRAHRAQLGLSLRAAAADAEVPFNTLSRVERGYLPDLANFRRIVLWLGVDPEQFFAPKVRTEATPDIIAHHLATDPNLPPTAAARIADLVRELYDNLAQPQAPTHVHLRAAQTFTPAASRQLGAILEDMQDVLLRRFEDSPS